MTLKPVSDPFESVRVSEITAVLLRVKVPVNVVLPVTASVPPIVAFPKIAVVESATVALGVRVSCETNVPDLSLLTKVAHLQN